MQKTLLMDKYHICSKEIKKVDIEYTTTDQFIEYFLNKINEDKIAKFIGIFDHYEHTQSLENGTIADSIKDAKNIVFCFGQQIPNPLILSVRPRSIAVVENEDSFTISFMEAPLAPMTQKMQNWVEELV